MPHVRLWRFIAAFTLVELITVIAVASILLSIGIPGFAKLLNSSTQTTAINQFSSHLSQARSEAVYRYQRVTLCPSTDLKNCTGGYQWQQGYIMFADLNTNRQKDSDEPLIAVSEKQKHSQKILTSTGRQKITFFPSGMSPGSNLTIRFCNDVEQVAAKALIISNTGRPRLSDKASDGNPINCS